jgi:hypothetical protein
LALVAAGASWWFRYTATHRSAEFWGPQASVLIREAKSVELLELGRTADGSTKESGDLSVALGDDTFVLRGRYDVSTAPGLVHLRHALLEDRSFSWPSREGIPSAAWRWGLQFSKRASAAVWLEQTIWFTSDCRLMAVEGRGEGAGRSILCEPIAEGLGTMFRELARPLSSDR